MRWSPVVLAMLLAPLAPARAQVSVGIGIQAPGVSIGIHVPAYPELVPVPGYPVYYAPRLGANYFFYDGLYWVYAGDAWYASSWYDGPWDAVDPYYVPAYVLRVPVRYYRAPPPHFRGWRASAPPRWGHHYGPAWEQRRGGWDRWDRRAVPRPAPLPAYQRQYRGDRYPRAVEQQREIRNTRYRYSPREEFSRQRDPGPRYQGGAPGREGHGYDRRAPQPARGVERQAPRHEDRGQWQGGQDRGGSAHQRGAYSAPQPDRRGAGGDASGAGRGPGPQRGAGDRGGGGERGGGQDRGHERR